MCDVCPNAYFFLYPESTKNTHTHKTTENEINTQREEERYTHI